MMELFRLNYRAHEALVGPARGYCELWRLAVGIILIAAIHIFLIQAVWEVVLSSQLEPDREGYFDSIMAGQTPFSVLFKLFLSAMLIPAVALVAMGLHHRAAGSVLGYLRPAWGQFRVVFFVQAVLVAVLMILPPYDAPGGELSSNLALGRWLMILPLSLFMLVLQCAAEELAFRGYLQQQLAARFRHPAVWMVLPAGFFAGLHYMPGEFGENAPLIALSAGLFGLAMADITARAGTLGPAIAMHVANNFIAILFIGSSDSLTGLALYRSPVDLAGPDQIGAVIVIDVVWLFVSWLAARLALRR